MRPHAEEPWNDWYHVTVHAYGSWLRGDPRGWRARHHREHVDGDYRKPPPRGTYDALFELSKALMSRDPVRVAPHLRALVVVEVVRKLTEDGIEVLIASVDAKHLHLLARFRDHRHRHWVGRAKKHASHQLRQLGLRHDEGGLWAVRSRAEPIAHRSHQLHAFRYIHAHAKKGAAIWTFKDPLPTHDQPHASEKGPT